MSTRAAAGIDPAALWQAGSALADGIRDWPRARAVHGPGSGAHRQSASGQGLEFWQYRTLADGQPSTQIDWRKSAQSDTVLLRQHQNELARSIQLVCDLSGSMQFQSSQAVPTKAAFAFTLAAACAHLAIRAGDAVSVSGIWPRRADMMAALADAGDFSPDTVVPRSTLIMVSDCLGTDFHQLSTQCRARDVLLIAVQVHDPAEAAFPYDGNVIFEGLEGEADFAAADCSQVRAGYAAAWHSFLENLSTQVASCDGLLLSVSTAEPLPDVLTRLLAQWQELVS